METSIAITTVKKELRLQEWAAQIEAQQQSGLTVRIWCEQNGISAKTYYYRLRKVRENCLGDPEQKIVPLTVPETHCNCGIELEKNDLRRSLPRDISADTLLAVVHELC